MTSSSMLHVRIEDRLKTEATATLAALGLTLSEAVRLFLTRVVVEQQLPFALTVPVAAPPPAPAGIPPLPMPDPLPEPVPKPVVTTEPVAKVVVQTGPPRIETTGFVANCWFD